MPTSTKTRYLKVVETRGFISLITRAREHLGLPEGSSLLELPSREPVPDRSAMKDLNVRLRDLPFSARLALTLLVLVNLWGFVASGLHMMRHHENREAILTPLIGRLNDGEWRIREMAALVLGDFVLDRARVSDELESAAGLT